MNSSETRTGVLVVRAWVEGESPSGLRARIISTLDVNRNESESRIAAGVDDITAVVHEWLRALALSAQPAVDG